MVVEKLDGFAEGFADGIILSFYKAWIVGFFKIYFTYLFIFGCVGSLWLRAGFL